MIKVSSIYHFYWLECDLKVKIDKKRKKCYKTNICPGIASMFCVDVIIIKFYFGFLLLIYENVEKATTWNEDKLSNYLNQKMKISCKITWNSGEEQFFTWSDFFTVYLSVWFMYQFRYISFTPFTWKEKNMNKDVQIFDILYFYLFQIFQLESKFWYIYTQ